MTGRPALREPMVWLVWGLPAASVVAGVLLVVTAIRSGGADEVTDKVQRRAQIQVSELGPDQRASAMKLAVILRIGPDSIEVFPVSGDVPRTQSLVLHLNHPTDSTRDQRLVLLPSDEGWSVIAKTEIDHDWIARLGPADGAWRVLGRVQTGGRAVRLGSALDVN